MAQIGNRKLVVLFFVILIMGLTVLAAMMAGVTFTGDNIIQIIWAYGVVSLTFFGANAGEHLAKRPKVPIVGEIK